MDLEISFRLIEPQDGPALAALMEVSPDAGRIGFSYDYQADLIAAHRALGTDWQGAVTVHDGRVIGMMFGDVFPIQLNGELRQAAYLSNLHVHPDFQRRGIAHGLADWGLAYVEQLLGPGAVLYGAVMAGNVSLALADKYHFVPTDMIEGGTVPMRNSPPAPRPDLVVRLAEEADLAAIADGMNQFYRAHNLWNPVSPAQLEKWLSQKVAKVYPNQLYIVARSKRIVGGLGLSDRTALVRMRIARAPAYVRMLGSLLGILPRSGILRALTVRRVWFGPSELEAGRYLWQSLRYQLRDRGDCLGIAYDPRDQLAELFQVPFWLPMFKARYLVRSSKAIDPQRFTYCIAGA